MNFDTDRQTLDDLGIFPNAHYHKSVFALFNNTKTLGGESKLFEIFNQPSTDANTIKNRIETISYFLNNDRAFLVDKQSCDFAEFYLKKHYHKRSFLQVIGLLEKLIYTFNSNNDYYVVQQGIGNTLCILSVLLNFFKDDSKDFPKLLQDFRTIILETFNSADFFFVKGLINNPKISSTELARADHIFRHSAKDEIKTLVDIVYQLDLYISVSNTAKNSGFTLPVINDKEQPTLVLKDLFHPFITNPVANNVAFSTNHNLCFVTGTNMAGKSTFLKAVGISIYLSQLGFPVPAKYMETSIFDGLITTINIDDNIDAHVAEKISQSHKMFVIFDELFRGTNVKDAYDASLAIISAFAKVKKCFFMVSTHIVEVANDLKSIENIDFRYMETVFDQGNPAYTYKLKEGITEERLGMWIVKNEGIVEIIERAVK